MWFRKPKTGPHDLRPQPSLLRPVAPPDAAARVEPHARVAALYVPGDPDLPPKSWAEVLYSLEMDVARLRQQKLALQHELMRLQRFTRYRP